MVGAPKSGQVNTYQPDRWIRPCILCIRNASGALKEGVACLRSKYAGADVLLLNMLLWVEKTGCMDGSLCQVVFGNVCKFVS